MTSDQIRQLYLSFFEEKGHKILPSSSLVPHGDPTLLLTSAGMVQFKPYFLGEPLPSGYPPRLTTCQKCFRWDDMEAVGDTKHLTFFEMLGNFSIGDYFKEEAIAWAWELVTCRLKLPPERLWITVFLDDDEAFGYWRQQGVPEERIRRFGEKDNFWGPAGGMGPCGPCSELHYDFGEGVGCGRPECGPNCDCPRFVEIWNLVFVQYNQDGEGKRTPLPQPHIDTGMGLERMAAVMQGKTSVYDTDLFAPLVEKVCELAGIRLGQDEERDRAARIVAEHGRGITFLIADGVVPANGGRGYVLRRVLRRAALFGRRLGLDKPFLASVAQQVIDHMGHVYPELVKNQQFILKIIEAEEVRFNSTLSTGMGLLEKTIIEYRSRARAIVQYLPKRIETWLVKNDPPDAMLSNADAEVGGIQTDLSNLIDDMQLNTRVGGSLLNRPAGIVDTIEKKLREFRGQVKSGKFKTKAAIKEEAKEVTKWAEQQCNIISGVEAFALYDTYGFPPELTAEIARERGFSVDIVGFEAEMEKQRERARAARKVVVSDTLKLNEQVITKLALPATKFTGYEQLASPARILSLAVEGREEKAVSEGQEVEVVLDRTPFYAEMGGQVADMGELIGDKGAIQVTDTQWARSDLIAHRGRVTRGALFQGEPVTARVEEGRRLDIARNHTATHLLQAALRQVLGSPSQAGASPSQAGVQQRGSLVAPDRLRFDYTHLLTPAPEELAQVQGLVNSWVRQNLPVRGQEKPYREAVAQGAIALFGEKYGETVRALQIGEPAISLELCGGTHLQATGEIGLFIIVSEGSIGSGLRRMEALTGRGAEAFVQGRLATLASLVKELQATPETVREKLAALQAEVERVGKRAQALERELLKKTAEALLAQVESVDGVAVLSARVPASGPESLREMGDWLRDGLKSAIIVLGAVYDDRPSFIAMVTPDLVKRGFHAAEIAKQVAKIAGGGGGGRAELAQAGGKDKAKLDEALGAVIAIVRGFSRTAREK